MENAVQALLIAAGVLIGVMILSLAVSLYSSLNEYIVNTQEQAISKEVQQFNEKFLKYINCNDSASEVEFVLTIQDIVTAANTAYENNKTYELTSQDGSNYYVTINLDGVSLESNINLQATEILKNGLGQEYRCSTEDVQINEITSRVFEVNFHKITP